MKYAFEHVLKKVDILDKKTISAPMTVRRIRIKEDN